LRKRPSAVPFYTLSSEWRTPTRGLSTLCTTLSTQCGLLDDFAHRRGHLCRTRIGQEWSGKHSCIRPRVCRECVGHSAARQRGARLCPAVACGSSHAQRPRGLCTRAARGPARGRGARRHPAVPGGLPRGLLPRQPVCLRRARVRAQQRARRAPRGRLGPLHSLAAADGHRNSVCAALGRQCLCGSGCGHHCVLPLQSARSVSHFSAPYVAQPAEQGRALARAGDAADQAAHELLGRCLRCDAPCDDYTVRSRCALCRLLVLMCGACAGLEVRRRRALALCAGASQEPMARSFAGGT